MITPVTKKTLSTLTIAAVAAIALLLFQNFDTESAATTKSYGAGKLTLSSGQSITNGAIILTLSANCLITLSEGSKVLWSSNLSLISNAACTNPMAAFESNGNLLVSGTVGGKTVSPVWQSATFGSYKLIFSSAAPYITIQNSDFSLAWSSEPTTLASFEASLSSTINAFGTLYSQYVPRTFSSTIDPGDRVDNFQAANGDLVRVLIRAPSAAKVAKTLAVPALKSGASVTAYFNSAITEAVQGGYTTVTFPKATYTFEAAALAGNPIWEIDSAQDLVIDGQGSTLNFSSYNIGVHILQAQRIVFKNFSLDWPTIPMASLGTIESIDTVASTMLIKVDSEYPVSAATTVSAVTAWNRSSNHFSQHLATHDESIGDQTQISYKGNQTLQVSYYNPAFVKGDAVVLKHSVMGGAHAILTEQSQDVAFESVNVYASPAIAFVFSFGRGYRISSCNVNRLPGRLISSTADAVHASGNQGDMIIENSTFAYQGDDGLNINAPVATINGGGQSSGSVLGWSAYVWKAKDVIGFFDANFGFLGETTITQNIMQNPSNPNGTSLIDFAGSSPANSALFTDLSAAAPRYIVRNNHYLFNRARGVLLQSAFGLVQNNVFQGQTIYAIYLVSSPFWGEGMGAQNLIVSGNQISQTGETASGGIASLGAVVVAIEDNGANTIAGPTPIHKNVIFDSNTINTTFGPGFFISTANNVVLSNNTMNNTNQDAAVQTSYGNANSGGSVVITKAHNVFYSGNAVSGTSGPISIDSTTTTGISGH